MNILVDIRLLSRGNTSGIEEYTNNLLMNMLAIDKENKYSFFYNGIRVKKLDFNFQTQNRPKIINWRIPNKLLDVTTRFFNFPNIDKFAKNDLIFSPHFNILKSQNPRIITFHDLSFVHHPYFFRNRQKFWHWLQDYKTQALNATKIIANSEFTKCDIINTLKIPEEKIKTIYPGINPDFKKITNQKEIQDFRTKHKIDYPFILYLGTLEPRKNITAIIRAFSLLRQSQTEFKNLRLILAGKPGWLYKNILDEAKNSKSKENIIFWGPVENNKRVFLYNLAEVFIYPSFFEGFGFPPLEAQNCGCPIIVSNRTSLPEIINDSRILIDPWRIDELIEKLKNILTDETLKKKIIEDGFINAKRFNWQYSALETLKFFNSV